MKNFFIHFRNTVLYSFQNKPLNIVLHTYFFFEFKRFWFRFNRRIIVDLRTQVNGVQNGPVNGQWKILKNERRWAAGQINEVRSWRPGRDYTIQFVCVVLQRTMLNINFWIPDCKTSKRATLKIVKFENNTKLYWLCTLHRLSIKGLTHISVTCGVYLILYQEKFIFVFYSFENIKNIYEVRPWRSDKNYLYKICIIPPKPNI